MAADQGNVVVDGGGAADRISDLPDHLLHGILIRLPSAAYAARTSVLSRRWRGLWTHLPELTFRYDCNPWSTGAALAAWSAPVLRRLEIALPWFYARDITPEHVRSWLRFASRRLAGELRLSLGAERVEEVVLPVSGRFTAITLNCNDYTPRLRFQPAAAGGGVFTALAALTIKRARMENRELEELVSSSRCCPRLKELVLEDIVLLSRDCVLSIRSDSLEKLWVVASDDDEATVGVTLLDDGPALQVATPELQELSMSLWGEEEGEGTDASIAAPKLSKVYWSKSYDPRRHRLVQAGRHLRRLQLAFPSSLALFRRFDAADELHLDIFLPEGAQDEYSRILEDASKIRCPVLVVTFLVMSHAFEPIMLHLLRKCVGIRKLVVGLDTRVVMPCKLSSCPCDLAHSHLTNGILLDSLQEVEVERAGDAEQVVRLVSLLCRCSETFQKKVHVTISTSTQRYYTGGSQPISTGVFRSRLRWRPVEMTSGSLRSS